MARVNLIVIFGVFVLVSIFCFFQTNSSSIISGLNKESNQHVKVQSNGSARNRFKLTGLFSFDRFKKVFKRVYGSFLEEMARKRLYLARAMQVFSSAIKYKYSLRTSYLAINRMSDLTPLELKRMYIVASNTLGQRQEGTQETLGTTTKRHQDSTSQEIVEDFHERIDELDSRELHRIVKRDTNEKRDLKLDDLFKKPITTQNSISDDKIASNNPWYSAPKVSSAEDNTSSGFVRSMPTELAKKIISLPVISFATDILGSTWNKYFANYNNERNVQNVENQCPLALCGQSLNQPTLNGETTASSVPAEETNPHDDQFSDVDKVLPDQVFVDHRRSNCLTSIKDQGNCGSCYIFATIAMYEWLLCQQTGNKVALSEQYVIDCGNGAFNAMAGCDRGNKLMIPDFVRHFGLELQQNYPYKGMTNQCPYKPDEVPSNIEKMGYLKLNGQNNYSPVPSEAFTEVLQDRPITLNVPFGEEFPMYGGGVDEFINCDFSSYHTMLIIGSGREDGIEYFLFKNSYGVGWGEEGYYKLDRKSPCISANGLTLMAHFESEFSKSVNGQYYAEKIKLHHTNTESD